PLPPPPTSPLFPYPTLFRSRLAHRRVDVVAVIHMHAHRIDERPLRALAHRDRRDVERRRLVRLAHVARPLRMAVVAALDIGLLGLRGPVALVTRMQAALDRV